MGILDRAAKVVGVEVKEDEQAKQTEDKQDSHQEMINIYWWLREKLDDAIGDFFKTGNYDELENVCQGAALERVKRQLADYEEKNIIWHMPDRRDKTNPQVVVLSEKDDLFVCEERFLDFSVLQLLDAQKEVTQESRNRGQPTASNSTVQYDKQGHYWFTDFFITKMEG